MVRAAVVTSGGGAIGFAVAQRLAANGVVPILVDRDGDQMSDRITALRDVGLGH